MISKYKSTGSAHVIIIVCLVVALVGTLGVVFYQNVIQKRAASEQATSTSTTQSSSNTTDGTSVSLTQFTSHKYLIRFNYPSSWSVSELVSEDQADWYASVVTVKNDKGLTVAQLGTGGQFGGACDPSAPTITATTIIDNSVSAKGITTAHYGYTIVKSEDGTYVTYYGLNKADLPTGTQEVQCAGMSVGYHYITTVPSSPVGAITFGSWAASSDFTHPSFKTLEEAKANASSAEMKQVQDMISSISVGE